MAGLTPRLCGGGGKDSLENVPDSGTQRRQSLGEGSVRALARMTGARLKEISSSSRKPLAAV